MNTTDYIAIISAGFAGVAAFASWVALAMAVRSNRSTLIRQAEANWDNVRRNYREDFCVAIEKAYSAFQLERTTAPHDITHLITSAGMPPNVPVGKSEHLKTWYINYGGKMNPDQRELWDFVTSIYPPRSTKINKVTDGSIIEEEQRDTFHNSRWEMSRFFQRNSKSIGNKKLAAVTDHAERDVILLTWLEIALIISTGDNKSGNKESLFEYAKHLTKKG